MENLAGLEFTQGERDTLLPGLKVFKGKYDTLRTVALNNSVPLPLYFNPRLPGQTLPTGKDSYRFQEFPTKRPQNIEDCAFYTIGQLAHLIRTRQVTSLELTTMYLERLKRHGPTLECVVTLTEELALKQARRADKNIKAGRYLGPLHGIPYGAKDLLAVPGYKTTWGAMTHKDQVLDETATVVQKLENAGAVLVAKLTLGALAWGDVWYGGKTRNPRTDHHDFSRRNFTCCGDLPGEKPAKMLGRFDHCPVSGNSRHRTERIQFLSTRYSRYHVHRQSRHFFLSQLLEHFRILRRPKKSDQYLVFMQ